jgi:putative two-component system response regulator
MTILLTSPMEVMNLSFSSQAASPEASISKNSITILIVDDSPENITILSELLQPLYQVRIATSGQKALNIAHSKPSPDLILLDVMMPGMDGYEVFEKLRLNPTTQHIPVIFVTAMNSTDAELRGLAYGAVDYITKPLVPAIILARIHTQLELKQARDRLANQNAWLESEIARRMQENEIIQKVSIRALAHLAETRDPETGNHILRTQGYVQQLAHYLQNHPRFVSTLTDNYIELLTRSAPLHDIGKVGIPDAILLKPGKLTHEEWVIMKTHAKIGADAIEQAEQDVECPVAFLTLAKEIARWHHEKWNGSGYPDSLAGNDIPVSARLMAMADVFDALISRRVYKEPMDFSEVKTILLAGRAQHFDPDILDVFLKHFSVFCDIAKSYRDHN